MPIISYSQLNEVLVDFKNKIKRAFVTEVKYDANGSMLKCVKNGSETDVTKVVTDWKDLDYVEEYTHINLLEYNKKTTGYVYEGSGDLWGQNQRWSTIFIDVVEGGVYTVFRKNQDSSRFVYTNSIGGAKLDAVTVTSNWNSNGFNGRSFTIPTGKGITKVAVMFQHDLNGVNDIMMFDGDIREIQGFIPFADGQLIQIGTEVSYKFDNSNSSISSTTLSSAIKELDGKIVNAGGGTVTSVNNQQPNGQGNVTVDATHIKLDGQNSQTVKQEFDTLKGRVDNCVTMVNGQRPISGEVTVNAGQINGTYGVGVGNLQSHLNTIKNSIDSVTSRANDNANRLTRLETKVPTVKVGDIISTFQDSGNQYTVGGVTYLYIGQTRTVQHSTYPQLASALGISGATNYQLPIISDTSFTFDNGQRRRNRKHYIVAHISS